MENSIVKITINEKCRLAALLDLKADKLISMSCLVYQGAMNAGLQVYICGANKILIGTRENFKSYYLPNKAKAITQLSPEKWGKIKLPIEFDIDLSKNVY